MGKPAFHGSARWVVITAVGACALAGCEGVPDQAPPRVVEQPLQRVCPAGLQGPRCDRCAQGYQDVEGQCLPDCANGLQCAHGVCARSKGAWGCACEPGFAGRSCERCAAGFQDDDGDGGCEPDCATAALACGLGSCTTDGGTAHCTASAPVVSDPLFTSAAWTLVGGAERGLLPAAEVCHARARMSLPITVPQVSAADPFAVTSSLVTPGDFYFPSESRGLARVGESMAWLGASELGTSTLACLGEGAQLGPVDLELMSGALSSGACDPFTHAELRFQSVEVVTAASCPRPGQVRDGQLDESAWTLFGEAELALSGSPTPSPALHLWMNDGCGAPRASTVMSVPRATSLPSPAVRFKMTGEAGRELWLSMGLVGPGLRPLHEARLRVVASGGGEVVTRCVPGWTAGSVVALELSMRGNGVCGVSDFREFTFDDFELVSDPACAGSAGGLFDSSFEGELARHWELHAEGGGFADAPEAGAVAGGAHSGASSLRLANARPCFSASARQVSQVPSGPGPAVVGWYRAAALSHSSAALTATVLGAGFEVSLPPSSSWTRAVLCLPGELAGLPVAIEARQVAEAGFCSEVFAREEVFFDDLALTTDPSCP